MKLKAFLNEELQREYEVDNFIGRGILREFNSKPSGTITHLEHLEDYILIHGKAGFDKFSNDVKAILDFFQKKGKLTASVKIDGAPAVFYGINPNNGKFFVSTKTIEAKNPKLVYSVADAKKLYDGELSSKLASAYTYLKKVYTGNKIYQCDLLFTDDKKTETIDGEKHITFMPNTIKYAIPESSPALYNEIKKAKMGAIVHTVYGAKKVNGENENVFARKQLSAMGAKKSAKDAQSNSDVYLSHPFHDQIKSLEMNKDEMSKIVDLLKNIKKDIKGITTPFDKDWPKNPVNAKLKVFINSQLRDISGEGLFDKVKIGADFSFQKFLGEFMDYMGKDFQKQADKLSSDAGKQKKADQLEQFKESLRGSAGDLKKIMVSFIKMVKVKNVLIDTFHRLSGIIGKTFVDDGKGQFKTTKDEGFVIISSNGPIKLVDRLEFSRNNFLNPKFSK
jgi:hypothetical protein